MDRRNPYRIQFLISLDLEKKARDKAYSMGLIKNGKGMVANYISMLIMNDLKNKPIYKVKGTDFSSSKKIKVLFPEELMSEVRDRAKQLGFIRNDEGNVSEYINYLLSQNL